MTFNPESHHRRSIRLRDYDDSRAGAYFVTVCAFQRECLFGEVVDGEMWLNDAGRMVQECWDVLPVHYPHAELDAFVVMPNHVHGIIVINNPGFDQNVGAQFIAPGPAAPDNQAKSDNQESGSRGRFCETVPRNCPAKLSRKGRLVMNALAGKSCTRAGQGRRRRPLTLEL